MTEPYASLKDWDYWIDNFDGDVVFYGRHLLHWRGRRLDLHKMVRADMDACFHTHPAIATRLILKGGYVEEVLDEATGKTEYKTWRPGMVGIVRPELCHRIHRLLDGPSYSLWLRGRRLHKIRLVGDGWSRTSFEPSFGAEVVG